MYAKNTQKFVALTAVLISTHSYMFVGIVGSHTEKYVLIISKKS